jgi:hypothetical protein
MEILKSLLWGKDITKDWTRDVRMSLEYDLEKNTLCGVALKESVTRLSWLGPSEDRQRAGKGDFCYYSTGFSVGTDNEMITDFNFMWDGLPRGKTLAPFSGKFIYRGTAVALGSGTRMDTFISIFGEPYFNDQDEGEPESTLFYEFGDVEWQVDFNDKKCLYWLLITTPPLLADERYRQACKVDKPWPPE